MHRYVIAKTAHFVAVLGFTGCLVAAPAAFAFDLLDQIGSGLESVGDAVTQGVKDGGAMASGKAQIRGTYRVPNSGVVVTCFNGVKSGYVLPAGATNPGAPGTKVYPVDCDKMAAQGKLARAANSGSDVIWPGEKPKPAPSNDPCDPNGDGTWHGKGGATRSAVCDAQDVNAQIFAAEETRRAAAGIGTGNKASDPQAYNNITKKANKGFGNIQDQIARDAAAARAQAAAAAAAEQAGK